MRIYPVDSISYYSEHPQTTSPCHFDRSVSLRTLNAESAGPAVAAASLQKPTAEEARPERNALCVNDKRMAYAAYLKDPQGLDSAPFAFGSVSTPSPSFVASPSAIASPAISICDLSCPHKAY